MRTATLATDATVRQPKGYDVGADVKAIIPGLSKTVEPKLDRFGQPIVRNTGPIERSLSPVLSSNVTKDPVVLELARRGITDIGEPPTKIPAVPSKGLPARELTLTERERMGQATRRAVELVLAQPGFKNLDNAAADTYLKRAVQIVRERTLLAIRLEAR
jgi:hypothetical protein